eukprot:NODE_4950_length_997_cov_145.678490_g4743_i0.p1 GENE.NODE_4950_length_997_cov_145.678490_g4743_i0~~NODE_4950_length_997_cov_145.678490_g4743_i0.p1  ORF type:complete len:304 (-),score=35.62 NODE_4950_length_997_cov_145.678490_g4743_i0:85-897(-)
MVGSHSQGENALHPLISINEAYADNVVRLQQERETVEGKARRIAAQLQNIDDRLRKVHGNAKSVEKQLREIFRREIEKVQVDTQRKLSLLLSDEAELRRQLHYYEWLDAFLKYQKDVVDPVDFLHSFRYHSALQLSAPSEIIETSPLVLSELVVEGSLDVHSVAPQHERGPHDRHYPGEFHGRVFESAHGSPYRDTDQYSNVSSQFSVGPQDHRPPPNGASHAHRSGHLIPTPTSSNTRPGHVGPSGYPPQVMAPQAPHLHQTPHPHQRR